MGSGHNEWPQFHRGAIASFCASISSTSHCAKTFSLSFADVMFRVGPSKRLPLHQSTQSRLATSRSEMSRHDPCGGPSRFCSDRLSCGRGTCLWHHRRCRLTVRSQPRPNAGVSNRSILRFVVRMVNQSTCLQWLAIMQDLFQSIRNKICLCRSQYPTH
jgi:hypothetical protein